MDRPDQHDDRDADGGDQPDHRSHLAAIFFTIVIASLSQNLGPALEGAALSIWAIVVWVTVVYLGEHYVADVVGGILYAVVALIIVSLLSQGRRRDVNTAPSE